MKLLFIFTGGTIGSTTGENCIYPDKSKKNEILESYKEKFGINFEYDTLQPYCILSENNTGTTLKSLVSCVRKNIEGSYDGIIVAHGTDTLQYSAAALSYALGSQSIPVCLVSANYPLENPHSNALDNIHGAVEFIGRKKERGVWVSYKNPDEQIKIHRGTRLLASNAFSDCFYSVFSQYYGYFGDNYNFVCNPLYREKGDETGALSAENLSAECKEILHISPYVGMSYPAVDDSVKYIIHDSYHSGTINTSSAKAKSFFEQALRKNIKIFITGTMPGNEYESEKYFDDFKLVRLNNIAPVSAYVKLWLAVSCGDDAEKIMAKSLAGDIVCKVR